MKVKYRKNGFTLIELMIVIVIIGILSIIAIPSYRIYITDSKIAEAYSIMDNIAKSEIAFYNDNSEFFTLNPNPATLTSSSVIESSATWDTFGYPVAVGSNVYFNYQALAGKIDSVGTDPTAATYPGNTLVPTSQNDVIGAVTDLGECSRDSSTPATYGVTAQNGLDWFIVSANADLNNNNDNGLCTSIIKVFQTDPSANASISSSGFVVLNKGN